jgi:hypothetical protein
LIFFELVPFFYIRVLKKLWTKVFLKPGNKEKRYTTPKKGTLYRENCTTFRGGATDDYLALVRVKDLYTPLLIMDTTHHEAVGGEDAGEDKAPPPRPPRPSSLLQCKKKDGYVLDANLFLQYQSQLQEEQQASDYQNQLICSLVLDELDSSAGGEDAQPDPTKRKRSCKRDDAFMTIVDGVMVPYTPRTSPWYIWFVLHPRLESPKFNKKFRLRFRMVSRQHTPSLSRQQIVLGS